MPTEMAHLIRHIRAVSGGYDTRFTDGQLLRRFIEHRDEAAVTAIVRRHGNMVWGVCRRILDNQHDAEDAFQATFLILVRKAGSIRQQEVVGGWLYGVAQQTAMKARAAAARRRQHSTQVAAIQPQAPEQPLESDVQAILDEELGRLPGRYRTAIVLCDLDGTTRKEAARQLRLPEGTVAGHLTRGRAILARRLTRRGVTLSAATVAAVLSQQFTSAQVPAALMSSTLKAVALASTAGTAVTGISIKVTALTQGVLKAMFLTKLKTAVGACFVAALVIVPSAFAFTSPGGTTAPDAAKDRLADTAPVKQEPPPAIVPKDSAPAVPPVPELPPPAIVPKNPAPAASGPELPPPAPGIDPPIPIPAPTP